MRARPGAVRPPCAVGRRTAPGGALGFPVASRHRAGWLRRASGRAVAGRRRGGWLRRVPGSQNGSVTPAVLGIVLVTLALSFVLAGFTAVLATGADARLAADAAARGALQAWRAAAGEAGDPADACAALAAFQSAYATIRAAAAYYAAANGARLDPQRPPALVVEARGPAVAVAVLQPLRLGEYAARLDPAHRELRATGSAAWLPPAPDWAAAGTACPALLP